MAKKRRYMQMPNPSSKSFQISARKNSDTWWMFYNRMLEIMLNLYKWEGFDSTVDLPTLERGLILNGNVCFFLDPVMGQLVLPGTPSKSVDVYNYQRAYYIHTASGYSAHLSTSRFALNRNGVVIYNNYLRTVPVVVISNFADRLCDAMRACDVNINLQKTNKIMGVSESQRLTLENILKNYEGNVPLTIVDKEFLYSQQDIPTMDMSTPFIADKVWTYITNIWNDFLTYCGIENATNQKRERLVTDEVHANYGVVEMERNTMYAARKDACREIKEVFGIDVDVRFNSNLQSGLNLPFQIGGSEDGDLYTISQGDGRLLHEGDGGDSIFPTDRTSGI